MRKVLLPLLFSVAALLATAAGSFADPNLEDVGPHRHFIVTQNGTVEIGPAVCDNANLQKAFNQFHNNLHVAGEDSIGPAAPGLNNDLGAEITATGC